MAKSILILFLIIINLYGLVQSAFVLRQRLKPRNPFAKSEIIEDDILVVQSEKEIFKKKLGIKVQSAASTVSESNVWEGGVVPYELNSEVMEDKCLIEAAMAHIMTQSCVHFRPKQESDVQYVQIYRGDGCFATVGSNNPENVVSIGVGCDDFGVIVHELMHVLGFQHEQSRHDRDKYLKVHYKNIQDLEGNKHNFDRNDKSDERIFTDFDYESIMMYEPTAFGKDGNVTIEPLVPGTELGQRLGLSTLDVHSINALYKCESTDSLVCTKFAQILIHLKNCHCEIRESVDLNLLKHLYMDCKNVLHNKYHDNEIL